jgi:hypothetical protein
MRIDRLALIGLPETITNLILDAAGQRQSAKS